MNRPEFEVMQFDKDVITTSGCAEKEQTCSVVGCKAECAGVCVPECGSVYDL